MDGDRRLRPRENVDSINVGVSGGARTHPYTHAHTHGQTNTYSSQRYLCRVSVPGRLMTPNPIEETTRLFADPIGLYAFSGHKHMFQGFYFKAWCVDIHCSLYNGMGYHKRGLISDHL